MKSLIDSNINITFLIKKYKKIPLEKLGLFSIYDISEFFMILIKVHRFVKKLIIDC